MKRTFFLCWLVLFLLVVGCAKHQSIPWATLAKEEAGVQSVSDIPDDEIGDICWKILNKRVRIQPTKPDHFSIGYALIDAKNECMREVSLKKVMKE